MPSRTRKSRRQSLGIETKHVFDVFQPGLVRGEASFAHKPDKKVFYVEHPTEGWRVFLRAIVFLHVEGEPRDQFLVAKKSGTDPIDAVWEPPKGQMEGKDGLAHPSWSVRKLLVQNIRRECLEEAKIRKFVSLKHMPRLVVQAKEREYAPNDYFQYHVFRATITKAVAEKAMDTFEYYRKHPAEFAALSPDDNEKDALAPYDVDKTRLMGRWAPTLVKLYLRSMNKT